MIAALGEAENSHVVRFCAAAGEYDLRGTSVEQRGHRRARFSHRRAGMLPVMVDRRRVAEFLQIERLHRRKDFRQHRIERLALDCGELALELEMFAIPKLLEMTGTSPAELIDLIKGIDPGTITDPGERKQLEAVQAFASLEDLSVVLKELGIDEGP